MFCFYIVHDIKIKSLSLSTLIHLRQSNNVTQRPILYLHMLGFTLKIYSFSKAHQITINRYLIIRDFMSELILLTK